MSRSDSPTTTGILVTPAAEGADIIAIDICAQIESVPSPLARPAGLEQTAAEVRALGGKIVTAHADVRSQAELRAAVDAAVASWAGSTSCARTPASTAQRRLMRCPSKPGRISSTSTSPACG
jgi:NAD(P)-dependent dehydrogenase (short-subunit alcohol dehydrogenase family)